MPKKNPGAEVIIVGAGPAGLSAATWCAELGLETIVFEKKAEAGGQLLHIFNAVENYLGVEVSNGRELRDLFLHTFEKKSLVARFSDEIGEIDPVSRSIVTTGGKVFSARALILATGVRRRRLNVPGEKEFEHMGLIESGAKEKEKAKDKTVLIVGGGDAALENALILAEFAPKVYVVHRRLKLTARKEFIDRAGRNDKIEFLLETTVKSIIGGDRVSGAVLAHGGTGQLKELCVDLVLVRVGVQPNSEFIQRKIDLDPNGYVLVDTNCESSASGVYAVGDVAYPAAPTISTAVGTGATAAKALAAWLERTNPLR